MHCYVHTADSAMRAISVSPVDPYSLPSPCAQILGFPVQLIGLLALPYLGVRWFVDGQSAGKDIEEAVVSLGTGCAGGAAEGLACGPMQTSHSRAGWAKGPAVSLHPGTMLTFVLLPLLMPVLCAG